MLQIFHFGTAQQDGNRIEFSAVCLDTKFDMTFDSEIWLSNTSVSPGLAYKFTIDLDSKRCTRTQIDRASVEFPSTHTGMACEARVITTSWRATGQGLTSLIGMW